MKEYILIELINLNNNLLKELISIQKELISEKPKYTSLSSLSFELNKSNQTIKYHLLTNFEPEKDFMKRNGKIYVDSQIVPQIRRHYEKK